MTSETIPKHDPNQGESQSVRVAKDLFAGTVGGVVQVLTGQPFDTVKVRLQTQSRANPLYDNALDCVKKTYKNDGFTGFYKGTLTPLIGIGACVSIQFGVLEFMKRFFGRRNGQDVPLSLNQLFVAGAASGLANSVVSCPVEHIRTRLQIQTSSAKSSTSPQYKGPLDAIRQIRSKHGIQGIYKGQVITMWREGLGYGLYFATYEYLIAREIKHSNLKREAIPTWKLILYGGLSGIALWTGVYPIDLIKSKLQTDGFTPATRKYAGSLDCLKQVVREEGMVGLYRGFVPCILRAAPVNAATFVAFEATMNIIGR